MCHPASCASIVRLRSFRTLLVLVDLNHYRLLQVRSRSAEVSLHILRLAYPSYTADHWHYWRIMLQEFQGARRRIAALFPRARSRLFRRGRPTTAAGMVKRLSSNPMGAKRPRRIRAISVWFGNGDHMRQLWIAEDTDRMEPFHESHWIELMFIYSPGVAAAKGSLTDLTSTDGAPF